MTTARDTPVWGLSSCPGDCRGKTKCRCMVRIRVSARWLGTIVTSTQREYFRRVAKKWIFCRHPSWYWTTTSPKSCCVNSPGKPSKRMTKRWSRTRNTAINSYAAVRRPV